MSLSINSLSTPSIDPMSLCTGGSNGSNSSSLIQILQQIAQMIQEITQALKMAASSEGDDGLGGGGGGGGGGMPQSFAAAPAGGGGGAPAAGAPAAGAGAGAGTPAASSGDGSGTPVQSSAGTNGPGSGTDVSSLGGDNAHKIAAYLQDNLGLNKTAVAGVLGNLQQESGLTPNINQGGQIGAPSANNADDDGHGYGLAQWGGVRKEGLEQFAASQGKSPQDLGVQLDYLAKEVKEKPGLVDALNNAGSADAAASVWCKQFELAADPQMQNRDQYAQQFLSQGL
ncbi:phage tail tip lysozyme [Burkholderia gladioli]|uniref:phage tail tip lysozyme n=1 Tax=Burkholderia gladioli TaxID=28095 RepID=UPI001640D667|nr:phage tail tip lysozyme [Burkholderia gladioli]